MSDHDHFEGKSAQDHLKEALLKGRRVQEHTHTPPLPTHLFCMSESIKELMVLLFLSFTISFIFPGAKIWLPTLSVTLTLFWALYKGLTASLVGFEKLGRMHKLVAEEKHEITHNRSQEREELTAMYKLKGFEEPLLTQVIDVLMSDDHQLLMVMLEEELGMQLESEEHPIKQGLFAFIGTFLAGSIASGAAYLLAPWGLPIVLALIFIGVSIFSSKIQSATKIQNVIWYIAIATLSLSLSYLVTSFLFKY